MNNSIRVFIRTDGGPRIGLGHLMRGLALAQMLQDHFHVIFVCKEIPKHFLKELKSIFKTILIEEEYEFFELLDHKSLVVTDGYGFKGQYHQELHKYCYKTVSIQDVDCFSDNIDLIINHLPGTDKYYPHAKVLSGPCFAIIREEFLKALPEIPKNQERFFISLGGTNNHKTLNRLVEILNETSPEKQLCILTTENNSNKIKGKNLLIANNIKAGKIVNLIDSSSISFITPGMVSYEVMARNGKAIVIALNQIQEKAARKFEKMKLVENLGNPDQLSKKKIMDALHLNTIYTTKTQNIFDGKSGKRILDKFIQISQK